jgi:hypothetical protein
VAHGVVDDQLGPGISAEDLVLHPVAGRGKRIFSKLAGFIWWRVIRWQMQLHRWKWSDVRRGGTGLTGAREPIAADGIKMFNIAAVPVTRYRYRGTKIPNPWILPHQPGSFATVS